MAVIEVDVYAEDAPNGTPLGTITDADVASDGEGGGMYFEVHKRRKGVGQITLSVDSPKADLLRPDRYLKWRVPVIDTDPLFGSWVRDGKIDLSSRNERGAQRLILGGPGPRDVLRLARLLEETYAPVPPASEERGSSTVPGLWRWAQQHRGAIAARAMEEGINQIIGTLLAPMHGVTFDWSRSVDSGGVAWGDEIEALEQRVGVDIDSFMAMLEEAGGFILEPEPDLLFHAWQTFPSRDLTASVIFQAAGTNPNVASEMARQLTSTDRNNAMLIEAMAAGAFHEFAGATGVRAHIGYLAAPIEGASYAEMIADRAMEASEAGIRKLAVEVDPTQHLPGKAGTAGSFWVGDFVGVRTQDGSGDWDYDGEPQEVTGIRVALRSATDGSTTDRSRRSLKITALLNDDEPGNGSGGTGSDCCSAPVITHPHPEMLCAPTVPGTEATALVPIWTWSEPGTGSSAYEQTVPELTIDGTPQAAFTMDNRGGGTTNASQHYRSSSGGSIIPHSGTGGVRYLPCAHGTAVSITADVAERNFNAGSAVVVEVFWYDSTPAHIATTAWVSGTGYGAFVSESKTFDPPAGATRFRINTHARLDNVEIVTGTATEATNPHAGTSPHAARCNHTHPSDDHDHDAEYADHAHDHDAEILTTDETDTTLVLAPDGVGGVAWRAEAGGGTGIWHPVMAQDPSDGRWYVVVGASGTAVMAEAP